MTSRFQGIERHPSFRQRAEMAAIVLAGAGLFALLLHFRSHRERAALGVLALGAAIGLVALLPVVGRFAYVGWMGLGVAIGLVTSPIVLLLGYALVVVPMGLALRLSGKDPMRRRLDANASTYWEPRPEEDDARSYLRQF